MVTPDQKRGTSYRNDANPTGLGSRVAEHICNNDQSSMTEVLAGSPERVRAHRIGLSGILETLTSGDEKHASIAPLPFFGATTK